MKNILFSGFAICLILLTSCGKDAIEIDPIAELGLQKIGEQAQGDTRIMVWGDKSIESGYEKLYIQVLDAAGNFLNDGTLELRPMMEMNMDAGSMVHSAPADPTRLGKHDLFESGVVFTMPSSGEHGKWELQVKYTSLNKEVTDFKIPVQVAANKEAKVKTIRTKNNDRYVLSFHLSQAPKIGVNEANFTLHKQESMMSFPAFDAAAITIDPRMPDMDNHGSPNNVQPTYQKDGHYSGKLNYTMSGFWRVNLKITIAGEEITEFFDQTF